MKPAFLFLTLAPLFLAACAENSEPAPDNHPTALSAPGDPDNPPVTMSGYLDTSTTAHIK